jgi:beta-N-acetylhexosaminidase
VTRTGIRDDVGQLLWIGFEGTEADEGLRQAIARGDVGAVVLFRRNIPMTDGRADLGRLGELNRQLHGYATESPLLIAVDQEGGLVQRVKEPATRWPPMLNFAAVADSDADAFAEAVGRALGDELCALGFDIDFAPVLDVHTNPDNPVIGNRAFSTDPEAAARRALAFTRGLDAAGIIGCGKHFPGHGDTDTDSHLALPKLNHDLERLMAVELLPFRRAAEASVPMLMTAHVVFSALDPECPATMSSKVLQGLLREQLGYQGLIVSDDLDMKAIADNYGVGEAAVAAVRAGCEALLLCRDPDHQSQARESLVKAATDDVDFRDKVTVAARRVRAMKLAHEPSRPSLDIVGCKEHLELANRLSVSPDEN